MKLFVSATALLAAMGGVSAAPFVLNNGPGDGTVNVGVDGFGSFGSSVGGNSTNAVFDPVGAAPPAAGTSFESGLAIRFGSSGGRTFLTSGDIGGSGGLANPTVSGTAASGSSSFGFGGLTFSLTQALTPLMNGLTQSGTVLTQTYVITNTSTAGGRLSFELLRYLDGDLQFNGSISDGGGRLVASGAEILFETDSATGSSTSTTFIGITGEGGQVPATGRYEIDSFSGLRARIVNGTALDDLITGDGADADEFIDAGNGYDVTLALRNVFLLDVGQSATYVTRTIFGNGTPDTVINVPEPSVPMLIAIGAIAAGLASRRRVG